MNKCVSLNIRWNEKWRALLGGSDMTFADPYL